MPLEMSLEMSLEMPLEMSLEMPLEMPLAPVQKNVFPSPLTPLIAPEHALLCRIQCVPARPVMRVRCGTGKLLSSASSKGTCEHRDGAAVRA